MPDTIEDVLREGFLEVGILDPTESLTPAQADQGLRQLRRLLNLWNAQRRAVYATAFLQYTLTPSLSPHTIGPTGATWTATIRPVSIEAVSLILNDVTPSIYQSVTVRDAQWWEAQTIPDLETGYPTDVYYQPDWPLGKLYFWPVPTTAWPVSLQARVLLDDTVVLADTFTMPPGYKQALILTLAEMLCRPFGRALSPQLALDASRARGIVFGNNAEIPRLQTADAGMTTDAGTRPTFNYLTGQG